MGPQAVESKRLAKAGQMKESDNVSIPENFVQQMTEIYGESGVEWLGRLPSIISECASQWSLTVRPAFGLSYNYGAPAVRGDGSDAVLKVGYLDKELFSEMDALRLFNGKGIGRLLEHDRDSGAMLLERLMPGETLRSISVENDEKATSIAAQVMSKLWAPAPDDHPFPTVETWTLGMKRMRDHYDGGTGPLPVAIVEKAEALFDELIGSMGEHVLLHGDLHHENILTSERDGWLAIDPKGVVGEREYEVGALLRNPMPDFVNRPDAAKITARRIDQLADELGFDRKRLAGWGLAQAVLSAWWSAEDHGRGWEYAIRIAELIDPLVG